MPTVTSRWGLVRRLTPPTLVFVLLSALFCFFWAQARRHELAILRAQTRIAADQAAARLDEGLRVRLELVDQIRREWRISPFVERAEFERRAVMLESRFPGYQAINWIDADGVIRWVVPEPTNRPALGADLHHHPHAAETFERAEASGETRLTGPIPLLQGGLGVAAYLPIDVQGERLGYVNGVFRIDALVAACLRGTLLEAYRVQVDVDGREVYVNRAGPSTGAGAAGDGVIEILGQRWRVRLEPVPGPGAAHRALLRRLLLAVGLLVAVGAAWLTSSSLERRRQALRSQERYRQLFEDSMDMVYTSSRDGRMLDVNAAGVEICGAASREQLLAVDIGRELFVSPAARDEMVRRLERDGFVKDYAVTLRRLDGRELLARISTTVVRDDAGAVVGFRGILRDESEHVRMTEQLASVERMQSLSHLAGGIAHDFNNILAGILGHASLLRARLRDDDLQRHVAAVEAGVDAATGLTNQLLVFARGDLQRRQPVDLNLLSQSTLSLIARTLPEGIRVEVDLDPELPTVDGDDGQLRQVLLNLLVNARDAMPEGGILRLATATTPRLPPDALPAASSPDGSYVRLSIADTGPGMPSDVSGRIFEPFFSTKPREKGTGLGLAVVFGVVVGHRGHVHVDSAPGLGTRLSVLLPVGQLASEVLPREIEAPRREETGRLLVVDDDDIVRGLLVEILDSQGFLVLEASDGVEAVQVFRERRREIDLVILDLTMPRKSGRDTFAEMKSIDPNVRVLVSSGFGREGEGEALIELGAVGFLQKPYRAERLLEAVRQALARAPVSP